MQIELTPAQDSFVELGIREGRFQTRGDAVRQALAQWETRERTRIEVLASLDAAEQSLAADEGEEYTPESLHALVESVEAHGRSRLGKP